MGMKVVVKTIKDSVQLHNEQVVTSLTVTSWGTSGCYVGSSKCASLAVGSVISMTNDWDKNIK